MSRLLFVAPPFIGHIAPTVSVGKFLEARGHDVAWAGSPSALKQILPSDSHVIPLEIPLEDEEIDQLISRFCSHRAFEAFRILWEEILLPLGRSMIPQIEKALQSFSRKSWSWINKRWAGPL